MHLGILFLVYYCMNIFFYFTDNQASILDTWEDKVGHILESELWTHNFCNIGNRSIDFPFRENLVPNHHLWTSFPLLFLSCTAFFLFIKCNFPPSTQKSSYYCKALVLRVHFKFKGFPASFAVLKITFFKDCHVIVSNMTLRTSLWQKKGTSWKIGMVFPHR